MKQIHAAVALCWYLAVLPAHAGWVPDTHLVGPLSGPEIRALIAGNTLVGGYRARYMRVYFDPSGVVRGMIGTSPDDGTWHIAGDLYCHRWAQFFNYVERCYRWYRLGPDVVLKNQDAFRIIDLRGHIVPGKPDGF